LKFAKVREFRSSPSAKTPDADSLGEQSSDQGPAEWLRRRNRDLFDAAGFDGAAGATTFSRRQPEPDLPIDVAGNRPQHSAGDLEDRQARRQQSASRPGASPVGLEVKVRAYLPRGSRLLAGGCNSRGAARLSRFPVRLEVAVSSRPRRKRDTRRSCA